MTKQRPPQITQDHLTKLALTYVRVSTLRTQERMAGSEHQRNQRAYALAWGWPDHQIQILEDLGLNGTNSKDRVAFRHLIQLVREEKVGAVFVTHAARLSRTPLDIEMLVALCRTHGTLLVIEGRILDKEDTHE